MKATISLPNYLTVDAYQQINALEHMSDSDKVLHIVAILSGTPIEKLKKLQREDLSIILDNTTSFVEEVNAEFYPIIEIEGQLYGYQPLTKMTLGEYVDLENLCKRPTENLDQITAMLYRPVLKHRFKSMEYKLKHNFKLGQGKVENILKYYTVEEYDSEKRLDNAEVMATLPVSFALGALSFFLQTASLHLRGTEIYSYPNVTKKRKKEMIEETAKTLLMNIGDGLQQFITSLQHPSLVSQEIKLSHL